jgi:hypothetical protein
MKAIFFTFFYLLLFHENGYCQIPSFRHNFTNVDSIRNPLIDSFTKKYDFVLAYMEQSSPYHNYKILALKNEKWSCWAFSDNYVEWTKKNDSVKVDTITIGRFWRVKKTITKKQVNNLLDFFRVNLFWTLTNDSLNQYGGIIRKYYDEESQDTIIQRDKGWTDQINYRFEAYKEMNCRIIQSYAPDYFVEKYPYMLDKKKFVLCRDKFLKWWEKYCH